MKKQIDTVDATPSKRLYLSIIADYDVNKAICELIDNTLDIWVGSGKSRELIVDITLDEAQQRIKVVDNAGGVSKSDLSYIVGPGRTANVGREESIGIFGVGTKRAVVALAQDVMIKTRSNIETHQVEFDDSWIEEGEDWKLPVFSVDEIEMGNTIIELTKLRKTISGETISQLIDHLGVTYARFLEDSRISILVNRTKVDSTHFDNWAYPPEFEPRNYVGEVLAKDGGNVRVEAIAGLTTQSSPAGGEYGVYFYCNDRLVGRALKSFDVGFTTGLAGKPHADISLTRAIVSLNGEARLMPWNSSKSDINTSHEVFVAIRPWLVQVVRDYSSLARRLSKQEGGWPENVFKHDSGNMKKVKVTSFPLANTSYLPPLPKVKPRYATVVEEKNEALAEEKPWTVGLYESIVAVEWILRQYFQQRNRIALLLLDSTLEIAFKEYLVKETGERYSDKRIQELFKNRVEVHKEVKKHSSLSDSIWKKINHYYDLRSLLIHQRATDAISDKEIEDFRSVVEKTLSRLFGLAF